MKSVIIKYGLISSITISLLMMLSMAIYKAGMSFDYGMYIGFGSMILAFSMVFFGIRNFREKVNGGHIRFSQGFVIGIMITLMTSICYVVLWQIINTYYFPEFMQEYANYYLRNLKETGISEQEFQIATSKMNAEVIRYEDPFYKASVTFTEIFPFGLLVTLVCAFVLKRKPETVQS